MKIFDKRAANKVWNPKEHLAAGPTAHENI